MGPTSPTVGTGLFIDNTGIFGLSANTQNFYLQASDGKAYFAGGAAILDSTGITVTAPAVLTTTGNASFIGNFTANGIIKFTNSAGVRIGSTDDPTVPLDVVGAALFSSTVGVTGIATFTVAPIVSSLTAGRVVFVGSSEELVDDADFTFSGSTLTVTNLDVPGQSTFYPAPEMQHAVSTEFSETSGVPPTQAWFTALAVSGIDGFAVPLHNLAETGVNPYADTIITRALTAGLWVCGYYRPVENLLTGYNALTAASKAALKFLVLDVEDVGHPVTAAMVTAAEAVKPTWIYTNWGMFGDVMGYGATGWNRVKLWMRDLYTVPATSTTPVPLDMYTAASGKTWESWPTLMPADWRVRQAVQWADPLTFTEGAESYACTYNVFNSVSVGISTAGTVLAHDHSGVSAGGNYLYNSESLTDFKLSYSSGTKHLLFGTIDAAHTSGTEGLDISFNYGGGGAAIATIETAKYGTGYRDLVLRALTLTLNAGTSGTGTELVVDSTNSTFKTNIKASYIAGSKSLLFGTIDSVHTTGTEGLDILYDFATNSAIIETAKYGTAYRHLVFNSLDTVFNSGTSGTGGILKIDQTGIHFRAQAETNYTTLARSSDAAGTITFPSAGGTVVLLDATQTLVAKTLTTPTIAAIPNNLRIGSAVAPTVALDVTGAALISSTLGVTGTTSLGVLSAGTIAGSTGSFTSSIKSSSPTAGIGYATGAGGTVTQGSGSGKATGVTLNKICGIITMNNASLAVNAIVSFTFTNSAIAAGDVLILNHYTTGRVGSYGLNASGMTAGSCQINVMNLGHVDALAEAIQIAFVVIKGVTS